MDRSAIDLVQRPDSPVLVHVPHSSRSVPDWARAGLLLEIQDEEGQPTGTSLLLRRGMDTTCIADTFKTQRRIDMAGGCLVRNPGEQDDAFAARLMALVDGLVAPPPMSQPVGTLAIEARR